MTVDDDGRFGSSTFEVLDATAGDVVAVQVGAGTPAGYDELYDPLARTTDEHGRVHVYEEAPNWTLATYLSHLHGVVPDLRDGPRFDIGRYAAVGDSRWVDLLYHQWRAVAPVRSVSPDEMRSYGFSERDRALGWVRGGADG